MHSSTIFPTRRSTEPFSRANLCLHPAQLEIQCARQNLKRKQSEKKKCRLASHEARYLAYDSVENGDSRKEAARRTKENFRGRPSSRTAKFQLAGVREARFELGGSDFIRAAARGMLANIPRTKKPRHVRSDYAIENDCAKLAKK